MDIDTFYFHYEFRSSNPWSINLPFLCIRCGNCCTLGNVLYGSLDSVGNPTQKQIKEIAKRLSEGENRYLEVIRKDESKVVSYLRETKCPFLLQNNTCEIYSIRPKGCQSYPRTDFDMKTEEGFCESLDRFKRFQKMLVKGYAGSYKRDYFSIKKDGVTPVQISKRQFTKLLKKLIKIDMTPDEIVLFKYLNKQ